MSEEMNNQPEMTAEEEAKALSEHARIRREKLAA